MEIELTLRNRSTSRIRYSLRTCYNFVRSILILSLPQNHRIIPMANARGTHTFVRKSWYGTKRCHLYAALVLFRSFHANLPHIIRNCLVHSIV